MIGRLARLLPAVLLVGLVTACGSDPASPEAAAVEWVDLSLEEANLLARHEGKVLLVYVHADWCGPCRLMDQTTWSDPAVIDWIDRNAVPYVWDTEDPEQRQLAWRFLDVTGIPTVLLVHELRDYARIKGYRDAGELRAWLTANGNPEGGPRP